MKRSNLIKYMLAASDRYVGSSTCSSNALNRNPRSLIS